AAGPLPRYRKKVTELEFACPDLSDGFATKGRKNVVVGSAIKAGEVEWPNSKNLSRVEVLKGFCRVAPPTAMSKDLSLSDFPDLEESYQNRAISGAWNADP